MFRSCARLLLFCHLVTRRWFCEAGSGFVFSAIADHLTEWSTLWVHAGTCAALDKACVVHIAAIWDCFAT